MPPHVLYSEEFRKSPVLFQKLLLISQKKQIKDIPNGVYLTGFFSNYPSQQIIDELFAFLNRTKIIPSAGKIFEFSDIRSAIIAQDEGRVNGKTVVKVC